MSLGRAAHHLRASVLQRISVPAVSTQLSQLPHSWSRGFAESTYLDKGQVTERILSVVKNFDKVDGSKVQSHGCLLAFIYLNTDTVNQQHCVTAS